MKVCNICGVHKDFEEFHAGHHKCKKCFSKECNLRKKGLFLSERFCVRCARVRLAEHFPVKGKTLRSWCYDCDSPEGYDWCATCGFHKPLEEFKHRANGQKCQSCRKIYQKDYDWLRKYGMTRIEYEALYTVQEGRCAICGTDKEKLVVDHDHAQIAPGFRALLCSTCNLGIGYFKDSPLLLKEAAYYLETHGR